MGCDIHIRTEVKTDKGNWVAADLFEKDGSVAEVYTGRSYDLFALLADVRNRNGIKPISEPRGIPNDCCQETLGAYKDWEGDAHSANWYTLKELEDYYKSDGKIKHGGYITLSQSEDLDNGILPTSWCQGTNASGYVHREWESDNTQLRILIGNIQNRADYKWIWNAENIRIVFWFDN